MRLVSGTHLHPWKPIAPHLERTVLTRLGVRRALLCPLRKGDAILRDYRVWHAGSPNYGQKSRPLPLAKFLAHWYVDTGEGKVPHVVTERIWRSLSPHAQHITEQAQSAG